MKIGIIGTGISKIPPLGWSSLAPQEFIVFCALPRALQSQNLKSPTRFAGSRRAGDD